MDIFWGGVDDNEIARTVLSYIPEDFSGKLLDVPVGTGVFTAAKYTRMNRADIVCLDYSSDMLDQARDRFWKEGIGNCRLVGCFCIRGESRRSRRRCRDDVDGSHRRKLGRGADAGSAAG